jgi:1-acyl-sn-glycerol-3-phosphate acyltransferase
MFQNLWYQIGRSLINVYVRNILRADIRQDGKLPQGAKIIAANHPSTNDPAFVTALTNEQTTILIKDTLFKVPVFGRSLRMSGHVPVIAGNGRAALEEGIRLLKAGRTVIIFPEGEISPENGFNRPHTGVARLALATGAPVIPVGISLNHNRIRRVHTQVEGKAETGCWYLRGPYAMTIGDPITFHGSAENHEQVRTVTGQIMQSIASLHRLSSQRLATDRTPRLGTSSPKAALHVAWKGTTLSAQQYLRVFSHTGVFATVEMVWGMLRSFARNI